MVMAFDTLGILLLMTFFLTFSSCVKSGTVLLIRNSAWLCSFHLRAA